jgi:N-acetylneuraminic acid mutarotase
MKTETLIRFILLAALFLLPTGLARAEQYHGNGDTGFGGAIGNGTLTLSDDGTNILGALTVGGSMKDVLVLYIQTGPGGFTNTSGLNDQGDACRQAVSGVSASGRSLLTFASGFQPNFAMALAPAAAGTGGLWQLANGGNNSLVYLTNVNLTPLNNTGPYTFRFPAGLIGMIPGLRSTIQVFGTYLSGAGYRSSEAIAGNLTGPQGWNPFTQTSYATYTFDANALLVKLPSGRWAQRASAGSPIPRADHTAVWTGSEMIVWGGYSGPSPFFHADGGRYNPAANTWTTLPTTGAPSPRACHSAVWSGSHMIIWGGATGTVHYADGGRYSPAANTWAAVQTSGAPIGRIFHTAVWTGSEMIVWGGMTSTNYLNDGGRYDPGADRWTPLSTIGAPDARVYHSAVWAGSELIVWGGMGHGGYFGYLNDGGRYNPAGDSWTAMPTAGAPAGRDYHTAVWTGTEMIVWGGYQNPYCFNDGGRYNPNANSWAAMATNGAPSARQYHTAVWTGGEMIVWGGEYWNSSGNLYFNDGGRYNPAANLWTAMSGNGAAGARTAHTAVWTGSEMIIWGGWSSYYLSDPWSFYPYAPAVRISRSSPNSAEVAWPVWYPTLRLCQTTNLVAEQWTTVTNDVTQIGAENHVTISPLSGGQFFRAEYP